MNWAIIFSLSVSLFTLIFVLYITPIRDMSLQPSQKSLPPPYLPNIPNKININFPTRGKTQYKQLGILMNIDSNQILPLFGRQTYDRSHMWNYYTTTDGYRAFKLPLSIDGRDCTESHGCSEIYDDDIIDIDELGSFKVTLYSFDTPRYIPL